MYQKVPQDLKESVCFSIMPNELEELDTIFFNLKKPQSSKAVNKTK